MTLIHQAYLATLDLIFPPRCAGCERVGQAWCGGCTDELAQVPLTMLQTPIDPLTHVWSSGWHDGRLADAIRALKFAGVKSLAQPLGLRLVALIQRLPVQYTLIPVPLHRQRHQERRYNQAQLLAQVIHEQLRLPLLATALHRQRHTRPQVGLNQAQRLQNVRDAFVADSRQVQGLAVLLVDDVRTTGATLAECANALLQAGAIHVAAVTVTAAHFSV